ncbi:MAG: YgcG family protein, partial [Pseudomonadota bacterium]
GVFAGAAQDLVPVPPLTGRVTDLTGTLTRDQAADLENDLARFERERGSQIAILLVPSTQPEPIEAYGIRVAEAWRIGRKGIDDGVIVLVAKDDRRLRIEVGYGLEGVLPDAVAKRIVAEVITPRFKQGDFYGGLKAGIGAIEALIVGEPLPPPAAQSRHSESYWDRFEEMLVIGIIAATVVGGILRAVLGRLVGSLATGGLVGALAWAISGSLVAALVAALLVLIFVLAMGGGGRRYYGGWGGHGGGWGSSGGGGFSGGGGGFGGGGASGNW